MSTREELYYGLMAQGHAVDSFPDSKLGLPAGLLRHREGSVYVVTVPGDASPDVRLGSLIDGLAWIAASEPGTGQLTIRLGASTRPEADNGAMYALQTLKDSYCNPERITIEHEDGPAHFVENTWPPAPFHPDARTQHWNTRLQNWYALRPTGFAHDVVASDETGTLRLYPQLMASIKKPAWSLRMDGLEIGRVTAQGGWLRIGKELTTSSVTRAWDTAVDGYRTIEVTADDASLARTHEIVARLIDIMGLNSAGIVQHGQPEHSFESAVLRGAAAVSVDGHQLHLPHEEEGRRLRVAWGSQIPTLWWPGGQTRYLDALMRIGSEPWAVELKVAKHGGNGRYLRQGLTQAVLYRRFLRRATDLQPWMHQLGLDPSQCQAALAIPQTSETAQPAAQERLARLAKLCGEFNVSFMQVGHTGLT